MKKIVFIILAALLFTSCAQWEKKFTTKAKADAGAYFAGFINKDAGCVVGYAGLISYTAEGSKKDMKWKTGSNRSMCMFGLEMIDEKTFIACGNQANVIFTKNGGDTWQHATNFGGQEPGQCRLSSFADANTGWIATPLKIGETGDFGRTWTELPFDTAKNGVLMSVCCTGPGAGYVFTHTGAIYKTANSGQSWDQVSQAIDTKTIPLKSGMSRLQQTAHLRIRGEAGVLAFVNDVEGKATLYIYQSADGGKTWKEASRKAHVLSTVYISPDMRYITTLNFDKTVTLFERSGKS